MDEDKESLDLNSSNPSNESLEKEELQRYVKDFQKQVEKKYKKSKMNKNFKINNLKHSIKKTNSINIPSSLASLDGISIYDLKCQNFKKDIEEIDSKNYNENEGLVEILSQIGKLDKKYLKNQIKKPDSILFKILCKSISKQINSLKETNSNYSEISFLYDSDLNKKDKLKKNKNNTQSHKKIKNLKQSKKNNIKKSLNKNEQIININNQQKWIKSINLNQKSLKFKNKINELGLTSCKNGKIKINSKLTKHLTKDIKLKNIKFKEEPKNLKNKKLKSKIASKINSNFISKENNKNNDKIYLTKEEFSALIYNNLDKNMNQNKIKKIKNNGVSIINNTKNVVTISNISKKQ